MINFVLVVTLATLIGGCGGIQDHAGDGDRGKSKKVIKEPNTDEKAFLDENSQESKVTIPSGKIKPNLKGVTLRLGDMTLKPDGPAVAWRQSYEAGSRRILISKARVTAIRASDGKELWFKDSADGNRLRWMTFKGNTSYFLGYQVDEDQRFEGYDKPPRIRRINLINGEWLKDMKINTGKGRTVKAILSAKVNQQDLAILSSLVSKEKANDDEASVVAYQVTCFRGDNTIPLWTKTFKAEGERGYGGVYVWGITPPQYAYSDNQHLNWMEESLIVAPEAMQPIIALNRDTGTKIWKQERIWEYDRGFIGPSVYSHFFGRFGFEEHFGSDEKNIESSRKIFNKKFSCAIIGGPVVVPLNFKRGSDSHSIFIAVSKAPARQWSGYLSDCVIYELSDSGKLISMVKLPQLVSGGKFRIVKDGLIWSGQNDSFVKLLLSRNEPRMSMGGGGTDLITRLAWFRQTNWQSPLAWLTTGRASGPVVFNESHVFRLPGGGYITNKGDQTFKFPISMLELSSGMDRQLVLHIPFEGTISAPSTNYSGTSSGISTHGFYMMAITELRTDGKFLGVTIGMEKWSTSLKFNLEKLRLDATPAGKKQRTRNYNSKIKALGSRKKLSEELRSMGHGYDVEYVKALLNAGANPKEKSEVGWTALMVSSCYGTADIVDILIAAGSDVNAQDGNCGGQTVLMWAVRSGQQSTRKVKALIKAGADIEATTFSGKWTALMSAVNNGNIPVVELLLSKGADVTKKDKDGHSLLWHANKKGYKEIAEILKKHTAKE